MTDAGFQVEEGVHQGAVPSGYLYSLGAQNRAMQNHRERVEAEGGGVTVILDDNTTLASGTKRSDIHSCQSTS